MSSLDSPIVAARRKRLQAWITDNFGSQAAFVAATGINQGELSGLLKSKSFGEKRAAAIETAANMPTGHLVTPLSPSPLQASQPVGLTATIIRSACRMARGALEAAGVDTFDPENLDDDAELLALAIEEVATMGHSEATDSDVLRFARKVNRRSGEAGGSSRSDGAAGSAARASKVGEKAGTALGRRKKSAA